MYTGKIEEYCESGKCTGCKMCGDICPYNAIIYICNEEGFWYPVIDSKKCTKCGLCEKKCPLTEKKQNNQSFEKEVYSAVSKDSDLRGDSTSGGMFGELAQYILSKGGVVAGCRYSEDYKSARHIVCDSVETLFLLIGTKYFQSDTTGIYIEVKKCLQEGKTVLFAGTPCQNAALKSFLGIDYENLYQMDFVCNSISSPVAYKKWIEDLEQQYESTVTKVRFKDKKEGWDKLNTVVYFQNGSEHREDRYNSLWGKGLIEYNLYQRKSCYNCNYRGKENVTADITVGDFWGLEDLDPYDRAKGVSLLIINTEKGKTLFEGVKKRLITNKKSMDIAIKGNPRIVNNPQYHEKRNQFFGLLVNNSFTKSLSACIDVADINNKKAKPTWQELYDILNRKEISFGQYVYLNYYSKNVIRTGEGKIIPYNNAIFDLEKGAKIILHGNKNFYVGMNKLKKSKMETMIRMGEGAQMELYHGGELVYGVTVEIKKYAHFEAGFFGLNTGSVVVCQRKITLGEDVMGGRNITIIDSDFHQMTTMRGAQLNFPQPVTIKDHVWLTGDIRILAGSEIGNNCIVDHFAVIKSVIPDWSHVVNSGKQEVFRIEGRWSRKSNNTIRKNANSKGKYRQILVGFGKEGKAYYEKQKDYIDIIIDNNSKDEMVLSFSSFCSESLYDEENNIFVIGSTKYYNELYRMIKKQYKNARIISANDIIYLN